LRGGHRFDVPLVVVPVGQQNDDAALAVLEPLEAPGAGGGGVADGGAEVANEPDVETAQVFDQPIMVERQRAGQIGHRREDDQPEPVVGPLPHEVLEHLGGDGKP
jgi:hypothetical protein